MCERDKNSHADDLLNCHIEERMTAMLRHKTSLRALIGNYLRE